MALKQFLSQKQDQRLSPQQIQLMKLLQVPTMELEQRIKQEIEENPALEEGKEATFFSTSGDLLDIRTSVLKMILQGKYIDLESRHSRLNSRYRNRPRP